MSFREANCRFQFDFTLGEGIDAALAGARVGYDDASHFNREYKRHFGQPPLRDVVRLREAASGSVAIEP